MEKAAIAEQFQLPNVDGIDKRNQTHLGGGPEATETSCNIGNSG